MGGGDEEEKEKEKEGGVGELFQIVLDGRDQDSGKFFGSLRSFFLFSSNFYNKISVKSQLYCNKARYLIFAPFIFFLTLRIETIIAGINLAIHY